MFIATPEGVYQSSILKEVTGVEHGFASRHAGRWPGEYTQVKQIHSNRIEWAEGKSGVVGEADALVTSQPGQWIGIRTADCVPILLADRNSGAVAAVHAGWRGTVDGIVARAVEEMTGRYGTSPARLVAAIGPCIASCCFEVGPEVAARFQPFFPDREVLTYIDLVSVNRMQLVAAGVPADRIDSSGLCTKCDASAFHSYRRDREESGRMVAAIRMDR